MTRYSISTNINQSWFRKHPIRCVIYSIIFFKWQIKNQFCFDEIFWEGVLKHFVGCWQFGDCFAFFCSIAASIKYEHEFYFWLYTAFKNSFHITLCKLNFVQGSFWSKIVGLEVWDIPHFVSNEIFCWKLAH